jgi:hypothetical protein
MQKDQLIVETADMLKIPLFTAEALLKVHGNDPLIFSIFNPVSCILF